MNQLAAQIAQNKLPTPAVFCHITFMSCFSKKELYQSFKIKHFWLCFFRSKDACFEGGGGLFNGSNAFCFDHRPISGSINSLDFKFEIGCVEPPSAHIIFSSLVFVVVYCCCTHLCVCGVWFQRVCINGTVGVRLSGWNQPSDDEKHVSWTMNIVWIVYFVSKCFLIQIEWFKLMFNNLKSKQY